MGTDCIFVAENRNGVTIQHFSEKSSVREFPGGRGSFDLNDDRDSVHGYCYELEDPVFAYCWVEFVNDLVIISDGCRYWSNVEAYQTRMLQYLKVLCGGRVGVWPDTTDIDLDPNLNSGNIVYSYGEWPLPAPEVSQ